MNKFKVRDENGIEREATIITKIEENQVNYLVYTIDRDAQTSNPIRFYNNYQRIKNINKYYWNNSLIYNK